MKLTIEQAVDILNGYKEQIAGGGSRGEYQLALDALQSEIQRLESELAKTEEYVPMTNDEISNINFYWLLDPVNVTVRKIEAEVIKRAGLVVKEKE